MTVKRMTAILPSVLADRVENYLKSPVSVAKSKTELIEKSLIEYLDREEVVAIEMEKVLIQIREGL
ncbi:MAG: hypothetical protein JRG71_13955 [Deltaproteobacteria bacterium]|nr:hypothetical protein [Deltaproteobacteria bacterium]